MNTDSHGSNINEEPHHQCSFSLVKMFKICFFVVFCVLFFCFLALQSVSNAYVTKSLIKKGATYDSISFLANDNVPCGA